MVLPRRKPQTRVDREVLRIIANFVANDQKPIRLDRDFFVLDPNRRPERLRNERK